MPFFCLFKGFNKLEKYVRRAVGHRAEIFMELAISKGFVDLGPLLACSKQA